MSDKLQHTAAKLFDTFNTGKSSDNINLEMPVPSPEDIAVLKERQNEDGLLEAYNAHFGDCASAAILGIPRKTR